MTSPPVEIERWLQAAPEDVWSVLTDVEDLPGWLGHGRIEPRVGGVVELITSGPGGGRVIGRVLRYDRPRTLEFTWRFEGEPITILRFEIDQVDGVTRLRLRHSDVPAELVDDYERGWPRYLDALEGRLRG